MLLLSFTSIIMKKIIVIIFLLKLSTLYAQSNEENYTIELEKYQNEYSILPIDRNVLKAIEIWKQYILTQNDSLLLPSQYSTAYKKEINNQLFPTWVPKNWIHFQIMGHERKDNDFLLHTLVYQLIPNDSTITIYSQFKVWAIKQNNDYKLKFLYEDNFKNFKNIKTKWINYYYYPENHTFSKSSASKANSFCDSVINKFQLPQKEQLNYYIHPTPKQAYEFFGHTHYWNPPAIILDNYNHIHIETDSEFYAHELVHYLFRSYRPNLVFWEGFASWVSGKTNFYATVNDDLALLKSFSQYKEIEIMEKMLNGRFYDYGQCYYPLGAVIMRRAYEKGGISLVKSILSTPQQADPVEIIREKFGFSTREESLKFVIQSINEYK